jgi:hypothetical protein
MTLADMGADVVRIDRPGGEQVFPGPPRAELLNRGKRSAVLDLKTPDGVQMALALAERPTCCSKPGARGWRSGWESARRSARRAMLRSYTAG